jgi:hypothetical protein
VGSPCVLFLWQLRQAFAVHDSAQHHSKALAMQAQSTALMLANSKLLKLASAIRDRPLDEPSSTPLVWCDETAVDIGW